MLLEYPTISRTHAVLTRYDDGSWSIFDCRSKSGTELNGEPVEFAEVKFGDVLSLGGVQFTLVPITAEQEKIQAEARRRGGVGVTPSVTLLLFDRIPAAGDVSGRDGLRAEAGGCCCRFWA